MKVGKPQRPPGPVLVEILGVAGSGKSSLTRALTDNPGWRRGDFIHTRKPEHLAHVLRALPRLLPMIADNIWRPPRLSWADFKLLVYVSEWNRHFNRSPGFQGTVTVLDQGPLYALVRLRAQNRGISDRASFRTWWEAMVTRWVAELDSVVWLDAPDDVLLGRIHQRDQSHATKGGPDTTGREFVTRYRGLFHEVLDRIDAAGAPPVLRFDTGARDTADLAAEVSRAVAGHMGSQGGVARDSS